jgi:hypothetical protein
MSKGTHTPIIKHISLKKHILYAKLNLIINIYFTKDTSYKIVLYNLITNNIVYNIY